MDRKVVLRNLAYRLSQAAVARDWQELALADGELAALLPRLAARGAWTADELQVLRDLRTAHCEALACCAREASQLDARLAEMCSHKDGWLAYALTDGQER